MYKGLSLAILAIAMVAALAGSAKADTAPYVSWNKYTNDCPTVMIGNATTQNGVGSACWPTSLSAQPGDTINVRVYYHNTGTAAAGNAVVTLNPVSTGASTSFAFTGIVSGGQAQTSGQAYLNLPAAETLTLSHVAVYPDQQTGPTYVSSTSIFSGGLSLGTIQPPSTCIASNSFCHQGSVVASFVVGNATTTNTNTNTNTGAACTITTPLTASPTTVTSGASSMLSWATSGCTSVSIAGGNITNNYAVNGQVSTGPLSHMTTFVLTAAGNGASHSSSAVVNVTTSGGGGGGSTTCSITSFSSSPASINSGSSSMLSWSSNCSTVSIAGGSVAGTYGANSSVNTGSLGVTTTYTITGYSMSGQATASQTATVTVNQTQTDSCTTPAIYASPNQVPSGGSTTLIWSAPGCSSATVTGPNFSQSGVSGSQSVGPIYGTQTYTITAYGTSGTPYTASTTVSTTYVNQTGSSPVATTLAAQVGSDGVSATLNGYINSNTGYSSCYYSCTTTTYYFQYGTSQYSLTGTTPTQTTSTTSGNASSYISGLLPNTTYYFQVIASNSYGSSYGGVLSFVTNGYGASSAVTAITTIPDNVTAYSARLNGLVTGSNSVYNPYSTYNSSNGTGSVYFEYGTSPSLGRVSTSQTVTLGGASNYFDTISTTPDTTYYYRIDAIVNGQTYMGSTVAFSTPGFTTNVTTNTNTTTTISRIGTGGGSAFLQLAITDQSQSILPGDSLNYVVTYQNISGLTLSNVVINVILPTGVTFRQSSQGVLTTNNTVAATIGSLLPAAQGTFTISASTDVNIVPGNNFVTTATAAFTLPSSAQDSAVAYVLNNVVTQNNLAGLALFGYGFFPTTLLGWILLLGLLLVLILIARYYYHRANAQRLAQVPTVTHVHYDSPAPTASPTMHGYNGDNLPH